jgi:hypothetical protein
MTDREPCDVIKHELRWLDKNALKGRVKIGCKRQEDTGTFYITIQIDEHARDFSLSGEQYEKRHYTELFNRITTWEESLFS